MKLLEVWVPGEPVAQGSMRSPKAGVVIHNSRSLKAWRDNVAWTAKDAWRGKALLNAPVELNCQFYLTRPAKPMHQVGASTSLDLDKLIRALGDALQGVVIKNDSRICAVAATKRWTDQDHPQPGVRIELWDVFS